jgi:hypothetical protein
LFASIFYFLFHLCFLSNLLFFLETPPPFFFCSSPSLYLEQFFPFSYIHPLFSFVPLLYL